MKLPKVRIRWKAAIPAVGVLFGVLTDPNAIGAISGALPPKAAHILLAVSALAAIFTPAVATDRHPAAKMTDDPTPPASPPPNDASSDYPRGE